MLTRRLLFLILTCAWAALGQDREVFKDSFASVVDSLVALNQNPPADMRDQVGAQVDILGAHRTAFLRYARGFTPDYRFLEDARTDKQIGSAAASLVSKGTAPRFFGFAVENGALTNSVNGTSTTFRGNLVGWLDLVQDRGFVGSGADRAKITNALRRFSYSLTLDSSRTPAAIEPGASLKSQIRQTGQQLANYSGRFEILDHRDPRTTENRAGIADFVEKNASLRRPELYDEWRAITISRLSQGGLSRSEVVRILNEQVEQLRKIMFDLPGAALGEADLFDRKLLDLFKSMRNRPLVAIEYVNTRLPTLPDLSTVRLIVERSALDARLDLTGNIAFTLQNAGTVQGSDTKLGGLRDFRIAAQGEAPLGKLAASISQGSGFGTLSLAFAYLSERLSDQSAAAFAGFAFLADPGWIHAGQVTLTIPVKGSGVKIPVSFSIASRTELIHEKDVRAHIGVTFDTDVLAAGSRKR